MADVAIQENPPPAGSPPRDLDARPSSAGSNGQLGAVEQVHPQQPFIPEELKGRLDKVIYSDVSFLLSRVT